MWGGCSFLKGPEGVLHVLQQLGEVRFDLNFTILNRVLNNTKHHCGVKDFILIDGNLKKKKKEPGRIKYLELHGTDLVQDLSHVLSDYGPGDFVVALRCRLHRMAGHVVESDCVREDADSFVEGAEPVSGKNDI